MDIEKFKQWCRECKEKKTVKTERQKTYDKMKVEQEHFDIECYAPKTKFSWNKMWWVRTCPACGRELKQEIVNSYYYNVILACDCGYAYAD